MKKTVAGAFHPKAHLLELIQTGKATDLETAQAPGGPAAI